MVFTADSRAGFCSRLLWKHELNLRSSHWNRPVKKGVLRNFANFTGKHLCWSLFLIEFSPLDIFGRCLEDVLKTSWRHPQNVLKMSWRCLKDDFAKLLEDVFARLLEDVLKTFLQDVLARRIEDVLKTYDQDEYIGLDHDTFWICMTKANIFVLIKRSWRRLLKMKTKDIFKTSSSRRMFTGKFGAFSFLMLFRAYSEDD